MQDLESLTAAELLSELLSQYGNSFGIATSFQKEGMVIVDLASRIAGKSARVFTLDTGRLPEATHQMIATVRERYGIDVEVVSPDPEEVRRMVENHGLNLFYDSSDLRSLCCDVRKVRPLARKLKEFKVWAAGLRRGQSDSRGSVPKIQELDGRLKVCPLADWSAQQVDDYIRANDVPVHPLYAAGYTSIGCDPCTRAITPGEDERAGRWWWESRATKECGIHFAADGTVKRGA